MGGNFRSRERIERLKKEYYKIIYSPGFQKEIQSKMKEDVFGPSPPNLLVGSYGWPSVNYGPLMSIGPSVESPKEYYDMDYSNIIKGFSMTLQGKTAINVHKKDRTLLNAQDAVMSIKSIDVEMEFMKRPFFKPVFDVYVQPTGASAPLKKFDLAENPRIPKRVDSLVNDNVLSVAAIDELSSHGFDNYYLTKILSAGLLGKFKNRKMVPTKWGITAIDDTIGKKLIEKIRYYDEISEYWIFENEFLHNKFFIIMIPGRWEYEQFEAWPRHTPWGTEWGFNQEYEPWKGRTKYAESQAGGYYAARLPVCEYLARTRKQARVIVIREIYDDYCIPVGVWQVRENVRHAFDEKPRKFASRKEVLDYLRPKLMIGIIDYAKKSKILTQKRLLYYWIR